MGPGGLSWPGLCLAVACLAVDVVFPWRGSFHELVGLGSQEAWMPMTATSCVTN